LVARICRSIPAVLLGVALLMAPSARADPDPPIPPPPPPIPALIPGADAAVAKAESILGTDRFGAYGCEALVAFAYDVPQAKYGWDGASETMYQTLLSQGQIHTDMNPPRGALVFSRGSDGPHIDLARGDGTYVSGGVQGLSRGWGDRHDIQILPTPNVGKKWLYRGWSFGYPR
jgi:hypothetical protein